MWQPLQMLGALSGYQQNPGSQGPAVPATPGTTTSTPNPRGPAGRLNGGQGGMQNLMQLIQSLRPNVNYGALPAGGARDFRQGLDAYGQQLAPWLQQMPGAGADFGMLPGHGGGQYRNLAMALAGNPSGALSAFSNGSTPTAEMQSWWNTRPTYSGSMAPFGG